MSRGLMSHPGVRISVGCVNKNFYLGHNFRPRNDRAFTLHMCIACDKTFHIVPNFFYLMTFLP